MISQITSTDAAFDRLHAAGWSIGEVGGTLGHYVYRTRGEQIIDAHGRNAGEEWQRALEQAEVMPNVVVEGQS